MTGKSALETGVLVAASAVLYGLGYAFQDWVFHFAEHLTGIHWFYLPAGLRVLLVLVAGVHGALGICLASLWINVLRMDDLYGVLTWVTAFASGFGAWTALWVLRLTGQVSASLEGLNSAALLQFALLYSGLNAMFHQAAWWFFEREGFLFWVDFWPMFVGDLLGAVVFLYAFRQILVFKKSKSTSYIG